MKSNNDNNNKYLSLFYKKQTELIDLSYQIGFPIFLPNIQPTKITKRL